MKTSLMACLMGLIGFEAGVGQVIPATPQRPITRSTGGGLNGGVSIKPGGGGPQKQRYVTHVVLAESRIWRSGDGKTLEGKLIAFEDLVSEVTAGDAAPPAPVPPQNPTVVRDGKVRLLVNQKAFEIPLTRLVKVDQDFIEQVRAGFAKRAKTQP